MAVLCRYYTISGESETNGRVFLMCDMIDYSMMLSKVGSFVCVFVCLFLVRFLYVILIDDSKALTAHV